MYGVKYLRLRKDLNNQSVEDTIESTDAFAMYPRTCSESLHLFWVRVKDFLRAKNSAAFAYANFTPDFGL